MAGQTTCRENAAGECIKYGAGESCIRGERRAGEMNITKQPAEGIEEQSRKQSQAEMSEACKGWRETEEDKTAFRNSTAIQHKKTSRN